MKVALLISTYNWPEALRVIFDSLLNQSKIPDEILIADDGSSESTREVIDQFRERIAIPVKHIWQPDEGFRKARILNSAIAQCDSDYIIQIDGDCIMPRHFIADHIGLAAPDMYLYGKRIHIRRRYVDKVLQDSRIRFHIFSNRIYKKSRTIRIKWLAHICSSTNHEFSYRFRGCNFSFWKEDFVKVGGYNEEFEGWGHEDSELAIRLHHYGISGRRISFAGAVFHLDHPRLSREFSARNKAIQERTILNGDRKKEL